MYECHGGHGWPGATPRDYVASHQFKDINVAVEEGMRAKSEEFPKQGAGIYKPVCMSRAFYRYRRG